MKALLLCALALLPAASPDPRFKVGAVLFQDDFQSGLGQWSAEMEKPGTITAENGALTLDVPAGCTLWFKTALTGPVMITYRATALSRGGANDRVSDLNCFWMARDTRSPGDLFATRRSGAFADYDQLLCYYVGLGGNGNTTTRFRRYIGQKNNRPLLPQNDLRAPADLLHPNAPQELRAVACGPLIQFYRDDRRLFELSDPAPYTSGWFGFRTVDSHIQITGFRVYRLVPSPQK